MKKILLFKERDVTASPWVQKMSGGFQHMGIPVPCSPTLAPNVSNVDNNNGQNHKAAAHQDQFVMPTAPVAISRAHHNNTTANFVSASEPSNVQVSFPQTTVPAILSFPLNDANFHLKDGTHLVTSPSSQSATTAQFNKPFNGGGSVPQGKDQHRQQVISDIAARLAEEKPTDPLMISTPATYQDGGGGDQPSPASSTQSITTQVMRFQASDNVSDAMLSAINYNDSEMMPADNFDGHLSVDDHLLTMRNNMNTPSGSVFGDLFDGDSNMGDYTIEGPQDPSMSPQSFSGLTDSGSLGLDQDTHSDHNRMADSEYLMSDADYSDPELQELQKLMRANTNSLKTISTKEEKKQKAKLKMQGVLAQQAVLLQQKEAESTAVSVKKKKSKPLKKMDKQKKCDPNASTSMGKARKGPSTFFRPTMLCPDSDSEVDLPVIPTHLTETPPSGRSRRQERCKSKGKRDLDDSYEIDFEDEVSTDSSLEATPMLVPAKARSSRANKRSHSAMSPTTDKSYKSPAPKSRKSDWRKAKNVPQWMPSSAEDSERDESDKTTNTRRSRFSEDEVAAMYAAAEPYKHNLKNNFKDMKDERKREIRQLQCVLAIQEAINDVCSDDNERQRHRWRIWAKLHDLRHTTKKKVREHRRVFGTSGAEGGEMPRLSRCEELTYQFYGREWIIGISGAREGELDGVPVSMAAHKTAQEEAKQIAKESTREHQRDMVAARIKGGTKRQENKESVEQEEQEEEANANEHKTTGSKNNDTDHDVPKPVTAPTARVPARTVRVTSQTTETNTTTRAPSPEHELPDLFDSQDSIVDLTRRSTSTPIIKTGQQQGVPPVATTSNNIEGDVLATIGSGIEEVNRGQQLNTQILTTMTGILTDTSQCLKVVSSNLTKVTNAEQRAASSIDVLIMQSSHAAKNLSTMDTNFANRQRVNDGEIEKLAESMATLSVNQEIVHVTTEKTGLAMSVISERLDQCLEKMSGFERKISSHDNYLRESSTFTEITLRNINEECEKIDLLSNRFTVIISELAEVKQMVASSQPDVSSTSKKVPSNSSVVQQEAMNCVPDSEESEVFLNKAVASHVTTAEPLDDTVPETVPDTINNLPDPGPEVFSETEHDTVSETVDFLTLPEMSDPLSPAYSLLASPRPMDAMVALRALQEVAAANIECSRELEQAENVMTNVLDLPGKSSSVETKPSIKAKVVCKIEFRTPEKQRLPNSPKENRRSERKSTPVKQFSPSTE